MNAPLRSPDLVIWVISAILDLNLNRGELIIISLFMRFLWLHLSICNQVRLLDSTSGAAQISPYF